MKNELIQGIENAWDMPTNNGPDPNKLPGLLTLAELRLDEGELGDLEQHFQRMRNRVVEMQVTQAKKLECGSIRLDSQTMELLTKNLGDLESVELALEMFSEAACGSDLEVCWEALGELEGAADELMESASAIAQFFASAPLVCTKCASIGHEHTCPHCQAERLILDLRLGSQCEEGAVISQDFLAVYKRYEAVQRGEGSLEELVSGLHALEEGAEKCLERAIVILDQSEREAQALAKADLVAPAVEGLLEGIKLVESVVRNRSSATLNAGWRMVFESGVRLDDLAKYLV
jgi:hypothetical protein